MIVCPQCLGKAYVCGQASNSKAGMQFFEGGALSPGGINSGLTFTNPTQAPVLTCPSCLGVGYMTQAGC